MSDNSLWETEVQIFFNIIKKRFLIFIGILFCFLFVGVLKNVFLKKSFKNIFIISSPLIKENNIVMPSNMSFNNISLSDLELMVKNFNLEFNKGSDLRNHN